MFITDMLHSTNFDADPVNIIFQQSSYWNNLIAWRDIPLEILSDR